MKNELSIINRAISLSRYLMGIAVFAIFVGSSFLLFLGALEMFKGIAEIFAHGLEATVELKIILIESVDTILVSTVLYVIAIGLYQLFIDKSVKLPDWLQTNSVTELEHRLSGLIVTILGVFFLTEVYEGSAGIDLLWLGIAIGAIIFSIGYFLRKDKS
jgi:uncharacterized membrane protein YqhA